jgi:hypothetical protein
MTIKMTDQEAQIKTLFEAVNKLTGEVAALTAYIADTGSYIVDKSRIRSIQGLAQERAMQVGNRFDVASSKLRASQMIEEINTLVSTSAEGRSK